VLVGLESYMAKAGNWPHQAQFAVSCESPITVHNAVSFSPAYDETLSVVAMRVHNPDCAREYLWLRHSPSIKVFGVRSDSLWFLGAWRANLIDRIAPVVRYPDARPVKADTLWAGSSLSVRRSLDLKSKAPTNCLEERCF
jgi:hypothetical protein